MILAFSSELPSDLVPASPQSPCLYRLNVPGSFKEAGLNLTKYQTLQFSSPQDNEVGTPNMLLLQGRELRLGGKVTGHFNSCLTQ